MKRHRSEGRQESGKGSLQWKELMMKNIKRIDRERLSGRDWQEAGTVWPGNTCCGVEMGPWHNHRPWWDIFGKDFHWKGAVISTNVVYDFYYGNISRPWYSCLKIFEVSQNSDFSLRRFLYSREKGSLLVSHWLHRRRNHVATAAGEIREAIFFLALPAACRQSD